MIVPSRRIKRELERRVARTAGRRYRQFFDIRWDEYRGCLCVFERKFNGAVSIRRELREGDCADGAPRQAHSGDIDEILGNLYGRRKATDNWYADMLARRAEREVKNKAFREDVARRGAAEVLRVLKYGARQYSLPAEKVHEEQPVKVTDSRRVS